MRAFGLALALTGVVVLTAGAASAAEGGGATATAGSDAMGTVLTLLAVAVLLWVLGNLLIGYRYDTRGPKGGPLPPP